MAEVTGLRSNAFPYPVYGAPWGLVYPFLDADGDMVTGATTPDAEVSKNGDTFADCTNESTEIATGSGMYYLLLTGTEMTADVVAVIAKSATAGMKTTPIVLLPRKLVTLRSGTSQAGAATTITLDSGASAVDDYYNGCLIIATLDGAVECRIIGDYVGSTKVATIEGPNWNTTPDVDDTFIIKLPEGRQITQADGVAFGGTAGTYAAGRPEVNTTHAAGTAWGSGAITAASIAADAITAAKIADGAIDAATFAAGAINAAAIAADAIGASELAVDAVTEIANAVWDTDATGRQTPGSFGQAIGDPAADTNTIYKAVVTDAAGATVGVDVVAVKAETASLQTDTNDIQSVLGTPAGASISADLAAIEAQTDDIGAAGAGLTALGDARLANLDATVSSRASQSSLNTVDDLLDTELPALTAAIQGLMLASGTIGATGNDSTHLHLSGLAYADDAINSMLIAIKDVSTGLFYSRWIEDFANAGDLATVATLPFTPEASVDLYWILPVRADVTGGSGLDAAGVRAAIGLASANLDTQLTAIDDAVDTEVAAILADTNELQLDWTNGGRLDLLIDAIKAKTDGLPADPADASDLAASFTTVNTKLDTIDDFLDLEVAAIKAKTDNLPTDPADQSAVEAAITAATSPLATASALSTVGTNVSTLLTRIPAALFAGITSVAEWLGLIAGKQVGNSTARTELRATGAGSGTYDETTDSQEATRDNMGTAQTGDAFARLGAPAGASVSADVAAVKADTAAVKLKTDNLPSDPADASDIASSFTTVNTKLDTIDDLLDTELPALTTAVDALPTNAELATALGTADDAVLAQVALVKAKTDLIPSDPADQSAVEAAITAATAPLATAAAVDAVDNFIDTEVAAIKAKTDLIPAAPAAVGDIPTAVQNADALIARNIEGGSNTGRTVLQALAGIRNKSAITAIDEPGGTATLTVYAADDVTPLFTAAISLTTLAKSITGMDPAA